MCRYIVCFYLASYCCTVVFIIIEQKWIESNLGTVSHTARNRNVRIRSDIIERGKKEEIKPVRDTELCNAYMKLLALDHATEGILLYRKAKQ